MANEVLVSLWGTITSLMASVTSKLIVAMIILLVGLITGKIIGKVIKRALHELELNSALRKLTSARVALEEIISGFVMYFIYFLAIIMALRHIGIATDVLNILSGAIILVLVVSVLLGVKDVIPNAFAGIIIHTKKFLNIGDNIQVKDMKGKIVEIGLVNVKIQAKNGDIIRIPNSIITNSEIRKKK